jgi:uncharacterized protein YkwD
MSGMFRVLLSLALLVLAACAPPPPTLGADGKPLPQVYNIRSSDEARIQFSMLDSVNVLRQAAGLSQLGLNAELTAAAATHARDMAVQNRPWHFGSDGSSPLERTARAGYAGQYRGEVISETYETELETLAAWMTDPDERAVLLDPAARDMGFAWFQEPSGKIWWALVLGGAGPQIVPDV